MKTDITPAKPSATTPPANPRTLPDAAECTHEIKLTYAMLALTILACILAALQLGNTLAQEIASREWPAAAGQALFMVIVGLLIWGNLIYQLTRLGYLKRCAAHQPATREELEQVYDGAAPPLSILVPSYKEEIDVVRRTLLSAALQDYPDRQVVLLIDDPIQPSNPADAALLASAQALPCQLQVLFDAAKEPYDQALRAFELRNAEVNCDWRAETKTLSQLYRQAARWLEKMISHADTSAAGERLLVDSVLQPIAQSHRFRAAEIESLLTSDWPRIELEYRRLSTLFAVRFTSFERKRYENLSHESNKAMNLNSYLGLLGGQYIEVERAGKLFLEPAQDRPASLVVPSAEFIITLDADSLLLPDYAIRLVNKMRRPGNERVAVAQTPYSSIPAAPGSLEHIAGATTDIQYLIHQGFTAFGATFWVGANALLRVSALNDIKAHDYERGYPIVRFIQDRTVIEDTESSIDLIERGWVLRNYPERLAYSATPPDFGALLIQRRRWANGGLIVMPKLIRHLLRTPRLDKLIEGFFRCHYLGSIAVVNLGLLIMMASPFDDRTESLWLPFTALPYFFLYARDLAKAGYRKRDLIHVYALNLLLIPINLGGVFKSIEQAITRKKIPFGRTPKVLGRTAAPALYVLAEHALLIWWVIACVKDLIEHRWTHAAFTAINSGFLGFAIFRYIGWSAVVEDLRAGLRRVPAPLALQRSSVSADQTR